MTAVAFALVAGGNVTLDPRPEESSALGVFLALFASAFLAAGLLFLHDTERRGAAVVSLALAGAFVVGDVLFDLLPAGEHFVIVRALVAVLVFGGSAYVLGTRRVVQLPTMVYAGFVVLIVAAFATSVIVSEFKSVSVDALLNWLTFGAAMYLAIAVLGRIRGPEALLETIVAAGGFVALKGIAEYLAVRAHEPTHRIFAGWNNPNALAGALAMVLPLALSLAVISNGPRRSFSIACGGLALTAIGLAQSKAALFVVVPTALVSFLVCALLWSCGRRTLWALTPLAAGVALFGLLFVTTPKNPAGGAPGQRIVGAGAEQAQSTEFRKLLWKGAIELVKQQPVGYGAGTYRFNSARSGLTEQTQLAHESYLQATVEGGVVALIGFVGLALMWTVRMFRGARALITERNALRAGVFAAVVACAADALFESNFYYFGAGLLLFVLVGTGLQLAADGTTPESMPSSLRGFLAVTCCAVPLAAMVWVYWLTDAKSSLDSALVRKDPQAVQSAIEKVAMFGEYDGDSWYLRGLYQAQDRAERVTDLRRAVELAPSTRNWRALAQAQTQAGKTHDALKSLERALAADKNNLRTLSLKLQIERDSGERAAAIETARRIVMIEKTPYLQVRALPELVPTEPFDARVFLASQTDDLKEKLRLLEKAVDGYARYRATTVPLVIEFGSQGLDYAGETREDAEKKMQRARDACQELMKLYGGIGDKSSLGRLSAILTTLTLD